MIDTPRQDLDRENVEGASSLYRLLGKVHVEIYGRVDAMKQLYEQCSRILEDSATSSDSRSSWGIQTELGTECEASSSTIPPSRGPSGLPQADISNGDRLFMNQ